jgi:dolichol-phosphate mannosyltransferase
MYDGLRECWENWPRSLPMRDASSDPLDIALGLFEVLFVQALPPVLLAALLVRGASRSTLAFRVNLALTIVRLATLAGTKRAYERVPATYWLSPLADLPAALALIGSTLSSNHVWRGRRLVSERTRA